MTGLLHLHIVPKTGSSKNITTLLRQAIREASATGNGRDTTLEDRFHDILSYYCFDGFILVRIATVDEKGKPLVINEGLIETLYYTVYRILCANYVVRKRGQYEDFYNPERFAAVVTQPDYLYVPDKPPYVRNLLVLHSPRKNFSRSDKPV